MLGYKKNPVSKRKTVRIEVDGTEYQATYVGKGHYSKVYRVGDRVIYYTRGDCSKEVLAMYQYDRMAHLPELVRHENRTVGYTTWYVFSSPFYRNVTTKDKSAYLLMKKVIRVVEDAFTTGYQAGYKGRELMMLIVHVVKRHQEIPRSIVKALQEIVDVTSNCGDNIGFDLHRGNFGVNEYGTLIFRDPVYVGDTAYVGES